jgi:hypothetical protein
MQRRIDLRQCDERAGLGIGIGIGCLGRLGSKIYFGTSEIQSTIVAPLLAF